MPYKPTGRPKGRPPKKVDDEERVPVQVDLSASGVAYLDARAVVIGGTRWDVIRAALREYRDRHPVKS